MSRFVRTAAGALLAVATFSGIAAAQDLTGAGSSFAAPIYNSWAQVYAAKTGVKINYQSVGSGAGINQISQETVDFGATDGPMTDAQMAKAKGGPIFHIPTVIGAVSISYNLPGVPATTHLKLTGPVVADIYLGKITKWNDPQITALNPGVNLPGRNIIVVHRSDASGTSYIVTDYLSSVSAAWKNGPGKGTAIAWPVGLGAKGNEGVAGQVRQIEGAIGYVELAYVLTNHMTYSLLQNKDGNWIAPSLEGATEAAAGTAAHLPANSDFRISIVNAPGAKAYPISSFTWILLYRHQPNAEKGKKLVNFLRWAMQDGDPQATALEYATLPKNMKAMVLKRLAEVTY